MFGGTMSLFIPTIKSLFITVEISWEGMWDKDPGWRYTLNLFNLSVNAVYILPLYQDTFAFGVYFGGGIGVIAADYTHVYNTGALTLSKQRATKSSLFGNLRAGIAFVLDAGMVGMGIRFYLGKLENFSQGESKLYYSNSQGLRVYDPGGQPSDAKVAELNLYRFCFEIFFGIRL